MVTDLRAILDPELVIIQCPDPDPNYFLKKKYYLDPQLWFMLEERRKRLVHNCPHVFRFIGITVKARIWGSHGRGKPDGE